MWLLVVRVRLQDNFADCGDVGALVVVEDNDTSGGHDGMRPGYSDVGGGYSDGGESWRPFGVLLGHGKTCGAVSLDRLLNCLHVNLVTLTP